MAKALPKLFPIKLNFLEKSSFQWQRKTLFDVKIYTGLCVNDVHVSLGTDYSPFYKDLCHYSTSLVCHNINKNTL